MRAFVFCEFDNKTAFCDLRAFGGFFLVTGHNKKTADLP
jgi:hypothetical protein